MIWHYSSKICLFTLMRQEQTDKIHLESMVSLHGITPRSYTFSDRGIRMSAIANMSTRGLLDVKTIKGTIGATFYDFILTHLIPHLLPYNGLNHHSVLSWITA